MLLNQFIENTYWSISDVKQVLILPFSELTTLLELFQYDFAVSFGSVCEFLVCLILQVALLLLLEDELLEVLT